MDDRLKRAAELEAEANRLRSDYKENPPVSVRTPWMREEKGEFLVGCQDEPQVGDFSYIGPTAMDVKSKNIFRASGVLSASSALVMYGRGRLDRGQISARTMREIERAADHLKDLAVRIRDEQE